MNSKDSEKVSLPTDLPPDVFRRHLHEVADWIADYRENIAKQRISPTAKPGAIAAALPSTGPETGEPIEQILADVDRQILPGIAHWAHPQFLGYFGCTTTAPGVLAEMIAAALNVNAMTWRTSPVATELETVVLGWLRQWLGLPDEFGGVVYDTASIASMHARAVAREEAGVSIRTLGLSGRQSCQSFAFMSRPGPQLDRQGGSRSGWGAQRRKIPSDASFG